MSSASSAFGAPASSPLPASALAFLRTYARTQRFRMGMPSAAALAHDGASVFFLRTEDSEHGAQNLYQLSVSSGEERVLVRAADLLSSGEEHMSDEERKLRERKRLTSKGILSFQVGTHAAANELLIPYQQHLFLFDLRTQRVSNLTQESPVESMGEPSYPALSPDGNRIAFVRAGDIFILERDASAAAAGASSATRAWSEFRLTFSGTSVDPACSNGIAEFIAQEELGRFKGMWWSPDSGTLLYQHTDTRAVEQLAILDLQRPASGATSEPYPRPGKANATVTLGLLRVQRPEAGSGGAAKKKQPQAEKNGAAAAAAAEPDSKKRKLDACGHTSTAAAAAAAEAEEEAGRAPTPVTDPTVWLQWDASAYPYVCSVSWSAGAPLSVLVQNRVQSVSQLLAVDEESGATRLLLEDREEEGWCNVDHSVPHWLSDGQHFLFSSETTTGFLTLYLHARDGKRVRALHESQPLLYRKLLAVDEARGVAYVLGGEATEQHIWQVPLGLGAGSGSSAPTPFTTVPAIHSGVFASGVNIYVHESHSLEHGSRFVVRQLPGTGGGSTAAAVSGSDPDAAHGGRILCDIRNVAAEVPAAHVPRVQLLRVEASEQLAWEELQKSNALIAHDRATNPLTVALSELVPKRVSLLDYTTAPPAPSSFATNTFNVAILRPHGASASQRFPVICYCYGGPGHRLVTQDRSTFLIAQFVADRGYIVVVCDNRGTPFRGSAWEKAIKGNYHEKPLADQVAVIRTLAAKDQSMDISRGVGMFGWSFGGYMSALAAMRYPSLFACTFVGAPVCDWRDYDTAYTERVLGLPLENESAYDASSVLTYASALLRPLLLVHGTADDNVYVAHAMQMADELFKHGREFTFLPLTGTHMLADPVGIVAMYSRLAAFFLAHIPTKA